MTLHIHCIFYYIAWHYIALHCMTAHYIDYLYLIYFSNYSTGTIGLELELELAPAWHHWY